jgi:transcriptional regulator GlxA family with amidase domain
MLILPAIFAATAAAADRNYSVAVVVAPGFYLVDAMGPLDVFRAVQRHEYESVNLSIHEWHPELPPAIHANGSIHVDLLAASTNPVQASDGVVVQPDATLANPPRAKYDLVVVPAGGDSAEIRTFLRAHYAGGGAIMSVCTGAEVLAELGLLDGREATTNSLLLWRVREQYPKVKWISLRDRLDERFVISQQPLRILTTAGVTAGIDGALHYISAWLGRSVAEAIREFVEWPLQLEQQQRRQKRGQGHGRTAAALAASTTLTPSAAAAGPTAYVHYTSPTSVSDDVLVDHVWETIPKASEKAGNAVFASMQVWFENGVGGYFGTQVWREGAVDGLGRRVTADEAHRVIFSVWDAPRGKRVGFAGEHCGRFGGEGTGSHCVAPYNFTPGAAYSLRVRRDSHNGTGDWWVASVQDIRSQGPPHDFGSLYLPDTSTTSQAHLPGTLSGFGGLQTKAAAFLEYFEATGCTGQPLSSVGLIGPWWQGGELQPSQAYPGYAPPSPGVCNLSDVSDCIYGAGCGPLRALFTAGGNTTRSHANTSKPLWPPPSPAPQMLS